MVSNRSSTTNALATVVPPEASCRGPPRADYPWHLCNGDVKHGTFARPFEGRGLQLTISVGTVKTEGTDSGKKQVARGYMYRKKRRARELTSARTVDIEIVNAKALMHTMKN